MMILSSDELEILEYLKSWKGNSISMLEICRCAGGRKKFKESPHWAKCMMTRLVEAHLIQVNERGHYRYPIENHEPAQTGTEPTSEEQQVQTSAEPKVIGDDYFPSTEESGPEEGDTRWWVSPQMQEILRQAKENKRRRDHQE